MVLDPETNPQIGWRTAFWVIASVVGLFLAFFIRWMPDSKQSQSLPTRLGDVFQLMLAKEEATR